MTPLRRHLRGLGAAAAMTALGATALAAPAGAATTTSGTTTIELKGAAAAALRSQQVAISAKRPARADARRIVLTATSGSVAKQATLRHGGSLTFKRRSGGKTRAVTLTALQTKLTPGGSSVTAKLGSKRITLFAVAVPRGRLKLTATGAGATGATVRLSPAAAKALRSKLALRRLAAGPIGSAKVTATVKTTGGTTPDPGTRTPVPDPGTRTPTPAQCEGFSSATTPTASDPLARPAGASSVQSAPMSWFVRDSWIRYMNTPDNGIRATDGANPGPVDSYPEPTSSFRDPRQSPRFAYSFTFGFNAADSWYDPATSTGWLSYRGTVRFVWEAHFIDLTFKDPEIELNGARSRVVFTIIGAACSRVPAKRVAVVSLESRAPSGTAPYGFPSLATTISSEGEPLFAGQYFAGNWWGSIKNLAITTAP